MTILACTKKLKETSDVKNMKKERKV